MLENVSEYVGTDADPKFVRWLNRVDALCLGRLGVGLFDLPDFSTWDAWDAGETPEEFFREVIEPEVSAGMDYAF